MDYFCDSSAIVKHYVEETGTHWVNALITPGDEHVIYIAEFTGAETLSAFKRRLRRGELTPERYSVIVREFRRDYETLFAAIEVGRSTVLHAMNLVERYALRGYDAIQLATALGVNSELVDAELLRLTFVSADEGLCDAASDEGMSVENPNHHR